VVPGPPGPPLLKFVEPFPSLVFFRQRVGDLRIDDGRWLARPAAAFTQVRLALLELGFLFLLGLDLLDKAGLALVQRGLALLEHGLLAFKFRARQAVPRPPSVRAPARPGEPRAVVGTSHIPRPESKIADTAPSPAALILFHRSSQSSQSSQMLALDCRSKSQIKHACPTARDRPRNSRAAASCRRPPYRRSKRSSPLWSNRVKQLLGKGLDMR
jgi:hypothetical protein